MIVLATAVLAWNPDLTPLNPLIERHSTIGASFEEDGFAGRVDIWQDRLALLLDRPVLLLFGSGFGSAIETGFNGHMLFLHIVVEGGLVGLLLFLIMLVFITRNLQKHETGAKPLFCLNVALLVSCMTQETFYPVPGMGHFAGLYLFTTALAFSRFQPLRNFPESDIILAASAASRRRLSAAASVVPR